MSEGNGAIVLKVDSRGRVRMPPERREALLEEFERCGMSGAAFAKQCGINYQTFAGWRKARRRREREAGASLTLAEVVVAPSTGAAVPAGEGLLVRLPGGASVQVRGLDDARMTAMVLLALAHGSGREGAA